MTSDLKPIAAVLLAVAITTTMDMNGLLAFSALPLAPLMAIFWYMDRLSRREIGFVLGKPAFHGLALLFPLLVMGAIAIAAAGAGAIDLSHTNWSKALLNLALVTVSTILVASITEEGFFRGWLWGHLERGGRSNLAILLWTSIAFALWHISAITLPTGFDVPAPQVPIFLANAAILGAIWGLLRMVSGSIIVSSVCHGIWNGLAYVLFGFGTHAGALGIADTPFYGPEVGLLGLALNLFCLLTALYLCRNRLGQRAQAGR